MKSKLTILLLSVSFMLLTGQAFCQFYTFKNYNHRDGLNTIQVLSINQSKDGYIWLGTAGTGLIKYDGKEFTEIYDQEDKQNVHIQNISFDGENVIYAGLYSGFYEYSPKNDSIRDISPDDSFNLKHPYAIYKKDNFYYFIGTGGVVCKTGNKSKKLITFTPKNSSKPTAIIETNKAVFVLMDKVNYRIADGKISKLKDWIPLSINNLSEYSLGYFTSNKLVLTNKFGNSWLSIQLDKDEAPTLVRQSKSTASLRDGEHFISASYNQASSSGGMLTNQNRVFHLKKERLNYIIHNYHEPLVDCQTMLTDIHGDYWIASGYKGIYKILKEPFVKLELSPEYRENSILCPYPTADNEIFLGLDGNETYLGTIGDSSQMRKFDFSLKHIEKVGNTYYLASNTGIRKYHKRDFPNCEAEYFKGQCLMLVHHDSNYLYAGVCEEGLHRINLSTGETISLNESNKDLPSYFYTCQKSNDGKYLLFGTNNGVYQYDRKTEVIQHIKNHPSDLGFYSGVSTKDIFGTCWFTLDQGIVGIKQNGDVVTVKGKDYFKSTIFYTLISDDIGNLIIGTNKGITILKTNKNAEILEKRHYDDKSGFFGYETNMRSQSRLGNKILVGTIEGLFLIDMDNLEQQRPPPPPTITRIESEKLHQNFESTTFNFQFHVKHAKTGIPNYQYRITGISPEWQSLADNINTIQFDKLSNGHYTLEVRASYDKSNFGGIAQYHFLVNHPIWKSNWFIILVAIVVILVNILLLNQYQSLDNGKLLKSKDVVVHLSMTPVVLFFASISVPASKIIGPLFVSELPLNLAESLSIGFLLLILFFLSLSAQTNNKKHLYDIYLKIALLIVIGDFMWAIYQSHLHPFNVIAVILTTSMAPYILKTIKAAIAFSLAAIAISVVFAAVLDNTVYPKAYFLTAIIMMASINIFVSYLRYDSLEKLIFISALINRGTIPAIAFNRDGTITYCSENIQHFIPITHEEILGENISILNRFIPFGDHFKTKDITKDLNGEEKYLVPMDDGSQIRWLEWAFRDFSKNIRVILGQDVSEKMELENTYELLVQNAEDFIYRCDIEGNFLFGNDICFTKLGYTKEELLGTLSMNIVADDYREDIIQFYADHFAENKTTSYKEFPVKKKNGELIWIGQYVTTLYAAGLPEITGFIALARDITAIRKQQEIIKEQRDSITSSISYARRIQQNLLPPEQRFSEIFNDHFIINKPKDIVSGDFYWLQKIQNYSILIVADCTGHGVPGSFMTLLGHNLLNSIVLESNITNPSTILNELDRKLQKYLPKGKGKTAVNDGMEISVCVFKEGSNEIAYGCAGSRFLIYEKDSFTMFKGDNKHIGDIKEDFKGYNTHYTQFTNQCDLFFFTDGFQDQFGGPKDKKYSFRRLLELFEMNINLPKEEQRKMIETDFNGWIGSNQQTDDITVVSIKHKLK